MAAPPTTPSASGPTPRTGELGAKLERLARENRPSALKGRGWIVVALLLLAAGGMLVQGIVDDSPSALEKAVLKREREAAPPVTPLEGPNPAQAPAPVPTPEPVTPPAPVPEANATVNAGSASALALRASRAPAKDRPALRLLALTAFGEMANTTAHRRSALEAAARLAGDSVPEEAELWSRVTEGALAALYAPGDAGAGVLYLGSLFDRGGALGVAALERIVDEEARPLELRVAAARALPPESRRLLASRIGSRANPHPILLTALR